MAYWQVNIVAQFCACSPDERMNARYRNGKKNRPKCVQTRTSRAMMGLPNDACPFSRPRILSWLQGTDSIFWQQTCFLPLPKFSHFSCPRLPNKQRTSDGSFSNETLRFLSSRLLGPQRAVEETIRRRTDSAILRKIYSQITDRSLNAFVCRLINPTHNPARLQLFWLTVYCQQRSIVIVGLRGFSSTSLRNFM